MDPLYEDLMRLSARQHAAVTVAQLSAAGITPARLGRLVRIGVLSRLLDGTYRFTGAPLDERARLVAACARPNGLVVYGPSAGRLWHWRRMPTDGLVHVIAPPASNPSGASWLKPYRTASLEPESVIHRPDGIRVTDPARTALDLTRFLNDTDLRSVVDQAIAEGRADVDALYAVAAPLDTRGRPWVRRFVRILDSRPRGGAPESHWESRVVAALVGLGVPVTPQRWLDVPNWGPVRLDASVDAIRWGVEIDVHPDHFDQVGGSRDRERDLACDAFGWRVSRVGKLSLEERFDAVMLRLRDAYFQRRAEFGAMRDVASLATHLSSPVGGAPTR